VGSLFLLFLLLSRGDGQLTNIDAAVPRFRRDSAVGVLYSTFVQCGAVQCSTVQAASRRLSAQMARHDADLEPRKRYQ
jgi:hypothetical protein